MISPNGVGLSPDGKTVYVADTYLGRLWAFEIANPGVLADPPPFQPGRVICNLPGYQLLDSLAEEGYGLTFGIGFLFSEDIAKSATEAPDTTFAVIDGFADSCLEKDQNLLCIGFKEEEGSFLVGAAAEEVPA